MTDIISIADLQRIQDGLGRVAHVAVVLLDPDGVPITEPTCRQAFASITQGSPLGGSVCSQRAQRLIDINRETGNTAVLPCHKTGLGLAAVPIFLDDRHLGSWFVLQTRAAGGSAVELKPGPCCCPPPMALEQSAEASGEFDSLLGFFQTLTMVFTDMVRSHAHVDASSRELAQITHDLERSSDAFRAFINSADIGLYVLDYYTGELLLYNTAYKTLFGVSDDELKNRPCYTLMNCDDFCPFCPRDQLLGPDGEPGEPVTWENYNEPAGLWLRITSRALRWVGNRLVIMSTFLDITARKQEEERIAYLAYHDQRLNLPNAVKLSIDLEACREQTRFVICFDIRGLRIINDVYGREAGDFLLRDISLWIQAIEGYDLTLYRVDGDDFVILLKNCDEATAIELAKRIQRRFDDVWSVDMGQVHQQVYTGAHLGVITTADMPTEYSEMLSFIERVLSTARTENSLVLFDERKNQEFYAHTRFEVSLKACVLNRMEGFSLHYQPIVDARTGAWLGLESLCRWNSPNLGVVPPDVFIHEAEQLGLISLLGCWVLEESIRQVKEWGLDQVPNFILDVNLSPIQLNDPNFTERLGQLLRRYEYPAEKLSLEITESAEINFDQKTLEVLEGLRASGISLSLDDFGTGYASFSNLKNLPVATLKTDRSFVIGIEDDAYLQRTVRIMMDFAHAAGLSVIAEGVETVEQHRILLYAGVDMIQGYYFSRPLPADSMAGMLDKFCQR